MKTRTVLNQIFRKAIDDDLMRKNPLQAFSFRLTGEASDTTQPYSVEEMRLMVERIGRLTNPNDIAYLAVATMQPLRLEETLGLQWQDVDCQAMALHIRRAVTHPDRNAPIVKETKTQEKRDVALTKRPCIIWTAYRKERLLILLWAGKYRSAIRRFAGCVNALRGKLIFRARLPRSVSEQLS